MVWAFQARHPQPLTVDAIDAHGVTFIGAHGVALMAQWARTSAAGGRGGVLRRSSRCVDRVLRLFGLDTALPRPKSE